MGDTVKATPTHPVSDFGIWPFDYYALPRWCVLEKETMLLWSVDVDLEASPAQRAGSTRRRSISILGASQEQGWRIACVP